MKTMNKVALSLAILMSPFFASAADVVVEEEEFAVTDVEVVDSTTLEVFFNRDISFELSDGSFEFTLTQANSDEEESEVLGGLDADYSEGSTPQSVLFTLHTEMLPSTLYELNVLSIYDVDGNILKEDVNSRADVPTPEVFPVVAVEDEDSEDYDEEDAEDYDEDAFYSEEEVDEDAEEALNSAGDEESDESDADATVELDAAGLPQTGTQEMLLVLVALLAAAGVVYIRRRA